MKTQIMVVDIYQCTGPEKGILIGSKTFDDWEDAEMFGEDYVARLPADSWFELTVETLH